MRKIAKETKKRDFNETIPLHSPSEITSQAITKEVPYHVATRL
jgi:hypothetical protein